MSMRYPIGTHGPLQKVALTLTSPLRWRSKTCPWIFDKEGGTRFQLAQDEHAKVGLLTQRLAEVLPTDPVASDNAFDRLISAIRARRLGYVSDWVQLAHWQLSDWDSWLRSLSTNASSALDRAPDTVVWRPHSRQLAWGTARSVAAFILIVFPIGVGATLLLANRGQVPIESPVLHSSPAPVVLTHRAQLTPLTTAPSASRGSPSRDILTPGAAEKMQNSAVAPPVAVAESSSARAFRGREPTANPRRRHSFRDYQALRLRMLREL